MSTADTFARTGNAELDDALALMERAAAILESAMGALHDAGIIDVTIHGRTSGAITTLDRAHSLIVYAARQAR